MTHKPPPLPTLTPISLIFFPFHAVFWKLLPSNRLTSPAPPLGLPPLGNPGSAIGTVRCVKCRCRCGIPVLLYSAVVIYMSYSIGSSGRGRGGARNMKSMCPPLVAIFFYDLFVQGLGAWPPRHPPWIRYC